MLFSMTSQGAVALELTLINKFDRTIEGGDIVEVEIDQMGFALHAVGIVAGGAGNIFSPDMLVVLFEAIIVQDTASAMTLIAEGVVCRAFVGSVGQPKVALQQRGVAGTVWPVGSGSAGIGTLIVVVTVGTVDDARFRIGIDQAGHIRILSGGFDGVVGGAGGGKLDSGIGLRELAVDECLSAVDAIGMAAVAKLIFLVQRINRRSGGADAGHSRQRA